MSDDLLKTMNGAPEIVRISAASANRAFRRRVKASEQLKLWEAELGVAIDLHEAEVKAFNDILSRWDPATQTIKNPESIS